MPIARFEMPDGRIGRFEVPEGTSPEQAQTLIEQHIGGKQAQPAQNQPVPVKNESSTGKDIVGGLARSGMGIVSNLMRPFEAVIPGGNDGSSGHKQRMNRVDQRFNAQGYDPQSFAFQGSKLAGDVAITAPVGGALAAGAKFIPGLTKAVPGVESALRTGGLRLGGTGATTAGQIARNAATRVGAGATVGGISAGMIDPETAGTGAMIGAALPPAVAFAGSTGRAIKAGLLDPLVNQKAIIGNTLVRTVGADNLGQLATNVTPKTPGVNFSLGQRTGAPGIAAIEDTVKAINPGGELSLQAGRNRQVLADSMRGLAQDENALAAAIQARKTATTPLYSAASKADTLADPTRVVNLIDRIVSKHPANAGLVGPIGQIRESLFQSYPAQQRGADAWKVLNESIGSRMSSADSTAVRYARTIMDRVKKGTLTAEEAFANLKMVKPKSKTAQEAVETARQYMKTPEFVLRQKPNEIMSAIDNIKAMLGRQENVFVRGELNTIKRALEHQLSKAAPEFGQAERTFAEMSRPINQMQVGQRLANTFIPSTAGDVPASLNAASLARALQNRNQVARIATQFPRAKFDKVLTPEQIAMVNGVSSDASRIAEMGKLGAGFGSPTARRQALTNFVGDNFRNEVPVLSRTVGALGNMPFVNIPIRAAGAVADAVGGKINQNMISQLETMLANNPDEVVKLMQSAATRQAIRQGLADERIYAPMLRAMLFAAPASQANP